MKLVTSLKSLIFRSILHFASVLSKFNVLYKFSILIHLYRNFSEGIIIIPLLKKYFLFNDIYEPQVEKIFKPKNGDIVVDIGAYIGKYSLLAAKKVGKNGKIFSFEPDPFNFDLLTKNVHSSGLKNIIKPFNLALSDKKGEIILYRHGEGTEHSIIKKSNDKLLIQTTTLDEFLSESEINTSKISWIKIDVEGAEISVLKGMKNFLLQNNGLKLIIEIHRGVIHEELFDLLKKYNFKIHPITLDESGNPKHIYCEQENTKK